MNFRSALFYGLGLLLFHNIKAPKKLNNID